MSEILKIIKLNKLLKTKLTSLDVPSPRHDITLNTIKNIESVVNVNPINVKNKNVSRTFL